MVDIVSVALTGGFPLRLTADTLPLCCLDFPPLKIKGNRPSSRARLLYQIRGYFSIFPRGQILLYEGLKSNKYGNRHKDSHKSGKPRTNCKCQNGNNRRNAHGFFHYFRNYYVVFDLLNKKIQSRSGK